jgi:hypothetical protein
MVLPNLSEWWEISFEFRMQKDLEDEKRIEAIMYLEQLQW